MKQFFSPQHSRKPLPQALVVRSHISTLVLVQHKQFYILKCYPLYWSVVASMMVPSTKPWYSAFSSISSACSAIASTRVSTLVPLRADIGTACTSPPWSSTIKPSCSNIFLVLSWKIKKNWQASNMLSHPTDEGPIWIKPLDTSLGSARGLGPWLGGIKYIKYDASREVLQIHTPRIDGRRVHSVWIKVAVSNVQELKPKIPIRITNTCHYPLILHSHWILDMTKHCLVGLWPQVRLSP